MAADPRPDITIRRAMTADAPALLAVLNPIVAARRYTAIDSPMSVAELTDWMTSAADRRGVFFLAERATDRSVLGWQALEPFSPYPGAFDHVATMATFVALGEHRQGIGARLFAASFAVAPDLGYAKIFTYVRADNEAGRRAYRGQGFEEVGTARRHCRIDGRDIDEIMIERMLDA